MSLCVHCGEDALDVDEGMLLCTKCGSVNQDRNVLKHDSTQNEGTASSYTFLNMIGLPKGFSQLLAKRRKENTALVIELKRSAKVLTDQLSFTKDMKIQVNGLIEEAFKARRWQGSLARALPGVCAFIVMTKCDIPVSVRTVARLMQQDYAEKFTAAFYQLLKVVPSINPGLKRFGSEFEVIMSGFKIPENQKKPLFDRVKRAIEMIGEIKCLDSILSVNFVIATTFVCWKSLIPDNFRYKFTQFCHIHEVDPSQLSLKTIMLRIKEITEHFLLCSKRIHYLKNIKITEKNVLKFVDDILRNEICIVHDMKREREVEWRIQDEKFEQQKCKIIKLDQSHPIQASETKESNENEEEEYISDTEIDSYIRTPEEIQMNHNILKSSQSNSEN